MNKIRDLLKKHNLTEYQVTRNTGQAHRTDALKLVASGDRSITSVNLNLLTSFARGLGLRLEDIVADYDLDGSTTQVQSIIKYLDRFREKFNRPKYSLKEFKNGGFLFSNKVIEDNIKLKTAYEFLSPELNHAEQKTNAIYLLNNAYLTTHSDSKVDKNKTVGNLDPRFNKHSRCLVIYSPMKYGGDLKVLVDVYNKNGLFMFSELFGCEWLDMEDNKTVCYYKYRDARNPIDPRMINELEKTEISETEFYKAFYSQIQKFNIHI